MRIAFVLGAFPALSETFVLNQITGLIDRGHDIDIFAVHGRKEQHVHSAVKQYNLMSRVHYDLNPPLGVERAINSAQLLMRSKKNALGMRLRALNGIHGKYAYTLRLICATRPFDSPKSYDIIYAHFGPNGVKASLLRKIGALSGKLAIVLHGTDVFQVPRQMDTACYRNHMAAADLLLPISDRWTPDLVAMGCDPQRIVVHRMGIDCRQFCPPTPAGVNANIADTDILVNPQSDSLKILTVARLVEKKGVQIAIRAFARLSRDLNCHYTIVGDGPLLDQIKDEIERLGIADKVSMTGALHDEAVLKLIRAADISLYPSITAQDGDIEGLPVAIMESLACEVPVIATAHSAIPELIEDGVTGLLVPERDEDALYLQLLRLAESSSLRHSLGRAGRERVLENWNIDLLNDRLESVLRALNERGSIHENTEQGNKVAGRPHE